jgi:hypothetical protein
MVMWWRFKEWALRKTEPWLEERASLMLEWRVFAQQHNAKYPGDIQCAYKGMELDPMDKMYVQDDREVEPDYLQDQEGIDQYNNAVDRLG